MLCKRPKVARFGTVLPLALSVISGVVAVGVFPSELYGQEEGVRPRIYGLAFSPDGEKLAAATGSSHSKGGPVVIWSVSEWKVLFTHHEPAGASDIIFSGDGRLVAFSTWGDHTGVVDVGLAKVTRTLQHPKPVPGVALTPDGKFVVTACHDHHVRVWDVQNGQLVRMLEGHTDLANDVDVSPEGTTILSCSNDGTARLWNLETGEMIRSTESVRSVVRRCAFSPDGRYFLTASWGGQMHVRETATGQSRLVLQGGGANCTKLAPDNTLLAIGYYGPSVHIHRIDLDPPSEQQKQRIGHLIQQFEEEQYDVREAATAELLAIGLPAEAFLREAMHSGDAEVRIRARHIRNKLRSPEPDFQLHGHSGEVEAVCFSPDGQLLATGCRGGDINIWRVGDWQLVVSLSLNAGSGHGDGSHSVEARITTP
jgi:WD40 repeat protein